MLLQAGLRQGPGDINAVFSSLNDDLSDVKNNVYGEESVKSPVTYSLLLVMRNGD